MPVLSNLLAISAAPLFILFAACQQTESPEPVVPSPTLSEQLGQIKIESVPFDQLPGETRAEKLLYQAGLVSQIQTASIFMFDAQINTLDIAGNTALANELRESRELLMQAMKDEVDSFVTDAGAVYEDLLSPEEIERLIVIHSDPVMQKLILNQSKISQNILPAATAYGERVGARYEMTLSAQKASE